jgi:hypothetical protein
MNTVFIVVILSVLFTATAFKPISSRQLTSSLRVSMAWGANLKLGQSVITPEAPGTTTKDQRISTPGTDSSDSAGSCIEGDHDETLLITKIDVSLRQRSLLLSLSNNEVPDSIKLGRIQMASAQGLMPSDFKESTIVTGNLNAGGLFKDWDFNLE